MNFFRKIIISWMALRGANWWIERIKEANPSLFSTAGRAMLKELKNVLYQYIYYALKEGEWLLLSVTHEPQGVLASIVNGIGCDPNMFPWETSMTVEEGKITVTEYLIKKKL